MGSGPHRPPYRRKADPGLCPAGALPTVISHGQADGKADGTSALKDSSRALHSTNRVASGRYRLEAPTDPYVLAFEHTVPRVTARIVIDGVERRREELAGTSIDTCETG